jgi:hypothetical protein
LRSCNGWGLLLQGYQPKFWYFEVVFLLLKLALSAFTVLFLPESVAQVRRMCCLSLVVLALLNVTACHG